MQRTKKEAKGAQLEFFIYIIFLFILVYPMLFFMRFIKLLMSINDAICTIFIDHIA